MSCVCKLRLADLLKGLMPLAQLRVGVPAFLPALGLQLGTPSIPAATLSAALGLNLPALPLPPLLLAQIAATANAVANINTHLGINLLAPNASVRLGVAIRAMNANLNLAALLPLLRLNVAPLMSLSLALSAITSVQARFGLNLLAPGIGARLSAALSAGLPAPVIPGANLSAYAGLAAAAGLMGGVGNLIPALRLLATLQLPALRVNVMALGNLAALLGLLPQLRLVLGINPLAAGAAAQIRLALSPLALLPPLNLALNAAAVTPIPAGFNVSARALARLNLSALLGLRLPNLAPLSLAASIAGSGGLAVSVPCAACGVAAALA